MKRAWHHVIAIVLIALCVATMAACDAAQPSPSVAAPTDAPGTSSEPALTPPVGATPTPASTDPAGTPVTGPSLVGALVCNGTDVTFPADVLRQPPNAELAANPASVALRQLLVTGQAVELGLPQRGWRVATRSADSVTFLAPGASGWAFATMSSTPDAGWQFFEGGACDLRVQLPADTAFATWRLDPATPLDPASDRVAVIATETACASGRGPEGRLLAPIVLYAADAITIAIAMRKRSGGQDCQGNPEFPVVVQLTEPLGARRLFDGSSIPPAQRN